MTLTPSPLASSRGFSLKRAFAALCALLALPLFFTGCLHSGSTGGSLVQAHTAADNLAKPNALYYGVIAAAGTATVVSDRNGNVSAIRSGGLAISIPAPVSLDANGKGTVHPFQFEGIPGFTMEITRKGITPRPERSLTLPDAAPLPANIRGEEHNLGPTLNLTVADVEVSINASTIVTHTIGVKMHYKYENATADYDYSYFVTSEYVAFSHHAVQPGESNTVDVSQYFGYHAAITPQRVMDAMRAATLMANYTIPIGGAFGLFYVGSGNANAPDGRLLYNSKAGMLAVNFGAGLATLNLTVDGYNFVPTIPSSLPQALVGSIVAAVGAAKAVRTGILNDYAKELATVADFLKITDFEMTISGSGFSNGNCPSSRGGTESCTGKLDYQETGHQRANTMDTYNNQSAEGIIVRADGVFGGPNAEEVAGRIWQDASDGRGMRLQFIGAGKGNRE